MPMFLLFPWLMQRWGFGVALAASVVITMLCFALFALLVRRWGIMLF
ncbi:hypothetical protein [Andreprevotia lacus]|nr:hypothetical protein [Andreprevotia lacus]